MGGNRKAGKLAKLAERRVKKIKRVMHNRRWCWRIECTLDSGESGYEFLDEKTNTVTKIPLQIRTLSNYGFKRIESGKIVVATQKNQPVILSNDEFCEKIRQMLK